MHAKINLKNSITGILYDFEKKMKKLKKHDLRMSALKGEAGKVHIIPFYDKKIKIGFSFFFLMKMVLGIILGYAHAKVNLKNSIKGILYDFEKKMKNVIFQFFDENLLSA